MVTFVGLDPAAASELAAHLDEAAADLEARAGTVAGLLGEVGAASSAPAEIRDVANWARYRSRDLRRRIAEITAAAQGGSGVQLRGFLFADRSAARAASRDVGKNVGELLRSHDKKKLDGALADLKRYGNDPAYAAAFFKGLGPSRTYALLVATGGRDSAPVVGDALVLARRTDGITVKFIDGIIAAARKAAIAVQAYTGAVPKEFRVQNAQDQYVRRGGSQHPNLAKYLEAIQPLTPYLEAGAKVAVIGGAVVIVVGATACAFLTAGACLGPTAEVLAGTGPLDAQAVQEFEAEFGDVSVLSDGVDAILSGLRAGRTPPNLEVDSIDELDRLFAELTREGSGVSSTYPGKLMELPDGTRVGLRPESMSGGPTIDLFKPDGSYIKVHLP